MYEAWNRAVRELRDDATRRVKRAQAVLDDVLRQLDEATATAVKQRRDGFALPTSIDGATFVAHHAQRVDDAQRELHDVACNAHDVELIAGKLATAMMTDMLPLLVACNALAQHVDACMTLDAHDVAWLTFRAQLAKAGGVDDDTTSCDVTTRDAGGAS